MKKQLRIGFIGCGKIATSHHAPEFLKLGDDMAITALYDKKVSKAKKLAKTHNITPRICTSLDEFLHSGVEAVVIATPNHTHCPLTLACLEANLHVLVEKPMAISLEQADRMCRLAKDRNLHFQVNQTFHFLPLYNRIQQIVSSGELGRMIHVRCLRASTNTPNVGWSPGADWFVSKRAHGGLVMDIAVHMADMMRWAMGEVESVSAHTSIFLPGGEVPDNVAALFKYKSGATGTLELSWTFPVGGNAFEFYGEKAALILDSLGGFEIRSNTGEVKRVTGAECSCDSSQRWFVDVITKGRKGCPVDGYAGRNALALCTAICKSSELHGKPVKPDTE